MDALVRRQYNLISCLGLLTDVGTSAENSAVSSEMILGVRQRLAKEGLTGSGTSTSPMGGGIEIKELLGQGSYGKVYKV